MILIPRPQCIVIFKIFKFFENQCIVKLDPFIIPDFQIITPSSLIPKLINTSPNEPPPISSQIELTQNVYPYP